VKLCTCEAGLCCAMRDQAIRAREANDRREHTRRSCNTRRTGEEAIRPPSAEKVPLPADAYESAQYAMPWLLYHTRRLCAVRPSACVLLSYRVCAF
jgi:hypothetical protein